MKQSKHKTFDIINTKLTCSSAQATSVFLEASMRENQPSHPAKLHWKFGSRMDPTSQVSCRPSMPPHARFNMKTKRE